MNWRTVLTWIAAILYIAVTFYAVYLKAGVEGVDLAFRSSLMMALVATILVLVGVFCLQRGNATNYALLQRRASYGIVHIVIWGSILFLPFDESPVLSLGIVVLFILASLAQIVALDEAARRAANAASMAKLNKYSMHAIVVLIIIAVLTFLSNKYDWSGKLVDKWDSVQEWLTVEESPDRARVNTRVPEESKVLVAEIHTTGGGSFESTWVGKINTNHTGSESVDLQILTGAGNVFLRSTHPGYVVNDKWNVQGQWRQATQRGLLSGTFILTVLSSDLAVATLSQNGQVTSTINFREQ